jgi:glycosyltransferase involved in cell wall biosynthesis
MPIHVRILAGALDRSSGSNVYHQQLIRRLADRGHHVSVVCFGASPDVESSAELHVVSAPPAWGPLWRFAAFQRWRVLSARLRRLELPPADVVIAGEHLFLMEHHRKFPHTPWIYLPHALAVDHEIDGYRMPWLMDRVTRRVYRHLQRWALDHADRTLRFTRAGCGALYDHYGGRSMPTFVVNPPGVDLPETVRRHGHGEELRLLSVGQLIPRKGLEIALRALARLTHRRWRYDIVGDGFARSELERQASELGLSGRVVFHGFQQEPAPWYDHADLLLFPSYSESCGLTLLEAMSHALPCLALRSDGARFFNVNHEIVAHGQGGLLADGEEDFQRLLEIGMNRPEWLVSLGRAARQHVAETFTWERHLDNYEALFDELTGRRREAGIRPLPNVYAQ